MTTSILKIILRRAVLSVPLIFAVIVITFFLIRLAPGDPAYVLAGDAPSEEFLRQIRGAYGLDQPILTQLGTFFAKAAGGDFGTSIYFNRPVFAVILERLPATLLLTTTAMVVASILGILMGVYAASRAGSTADAAISAVSMIGYSIPGFWLGQVLILVFVIHLGWFPTGGMVSVRESYEGWAHILDVARHMVLPVITLAVLLTTLIARFTRTAMIEQLSRDFVLVAKAKGASRQRILWAHAFRAGVTTTVTIVGLEFGMVLGGAVLTETLFSWPGLGRLFYEAIAKRDFPLLTGAFIFSSVLVIAVNTITDVVCAMLDPRLRK